MVLCCDSINHRPAHVCTPCLRCDQKKPTPMSFGLYVQANLIEVLERTGHEVQ